MAIALGNQIGQFIARKRAEEALKSGRSGTQYIRQRSIWVFHVAPEGRFLRANASMARVPVMGRQKSSL